MGGNKCLAKRESGGLGTPLATPPRNPLETCRVEPCCYFLAKGPETDHVGCNQVTWSEGLHVKQRVKHEKGRGKPSTKWAGVGGGAGETLA